MNHTLKTNSSTVRANEPTYGRFFGLYSLIDNHRGVLSIFIRMKGEKHYILYERISLQSGKAASTYLHAIESSAKLFIVKTVFE
jgi:hypothetical protein